MSESFWSTTTSRLGGWKMGQGQGGAAGKPITPQPSPPGTKTAPDVTDKAGLGRPRTQTRFGGITGERAQVAWKTLLGQ